MAARATASKLSATLRTSEKLFKNLSSKFAGRESELTDWLGTTLSVSMHRNCDENATE